MSGEARTRIRGLVLQGGGAKGAFQYGVLDELRRAGFDFDVIAGTSVGALNGAVVATESWDQGEMLWSGLTMGRAFNWRRLAAFYTFLSIPGILYHGWVTSEFEVAIPKSLRYVFTGLTALPMIGLSIGLDFILRSESLGTRAMALLWTFALVVTAIVTMQKPNSPSRMITSFGFVPFVCLGFAYACIHPIFAVAILLFAPWRAPGYFFGAMFFFLPALLTIVGYLHRKINASLLSNAPLRAVITKVTQRPFKKPFFVTTSEIISSYVDPDDYEFTRYGRSPIFEVIQRAGFLPRYNRVDALPANDAIEILLSSAALPLGIVPTGLGKIKDVRVVDGGLADNIPWYPLIDCLPCSEILIILCEPFSSSLSPSIESWKIMDRNIRVILERHTIPNYDSKGLWDIPSITVKNDPPTVVAMREPENWRSSQPVTIAVIAPKQSLGGLISATMNFDKARALVNISLGREAAREAISGGLRP